jgi:hypothetical protein
VLPDRGRVKTRECRNQARLYGVYFVAWGFRAVSIAAWSPLIRSVLTVQLEQEDPLPCLLSAMGSLTDAYRGPLLLSLGKRAASSWSVRPVLFTGALFRASLVLFRRVSCPPLGSSRYPKS